MRDDRRDCRYDYRAGTARESPRQTEPFKCIKNAKIAGFDVTTSFIPISIATSPPVRRKTGAQEGSFMNNKMNETSAAMINSPAAA